MAVSSHQFDSDIADLNAQNLLEILERTLHPGKNEWLFFRELRVGSGFRNGAAQRLDAFALNCLPHLGMKRVCYEVKVSRSDFLAELKRPLKRRIGMRYSNEFYFITPKALLDCAEIPVDCGLIEVGAFSPEERQLMTISGGPLFWFDQSSGLYCALKVPACWRDTPGPTWQFAAAMLRNQRKEFEDKPPAPLKQQRLDLCQLDEAKRG